MRTKEHKDFMIMNQKKEYQLELVNELLDKEEGRQNAQQEERKRQKHYQKMDKEYERKKLEAELKELEKKRLYDEKLKQKL